MSFFSNQRQHFISHAANDKRTGPHASIFILNHPNFLRGFLIQQAPEVPVETSGMQQSCFIVFLSNVQLEALIKSKHCTGFHGGRLFFSFVIVLTQNRQHPTPACTGPSSPGTGAHHLRGRVGNYLLLVL